MQLAIAKQQKKQGNKLEEKHFIQKMKSNVGMIFIVPHKSKGTR